MGGVPAEKKVVLNFERSILELIKGTLCIQKYNPVSQQWGKIPPGRRQLAMRNASNE